MKKILVIQNKRIGDVLISSVIANNIKKIFPNSHVTYFVYDYTVGVLQNNPNIDEIIIANDRKLKNILELIRVIRRVRKTKFDIIFDPYAKFQSRMICLFSRAKYRIGLKRVHKKLKLPFYTHPISFLEEKSKNCGKAIEDRIHMISSVFDLSDADYEPKIFLTNEEQEYSFIKKIEIPKIMLGVLGSTPQKSMPYENIARIIDFITTKYDVTILFNYTPHQKVEAEKIYSLCKNQSDIDLSIYEDSIRGFILLMNKCDLLVANEGGSVHITKALRKPTFTIYSPYVNKDHWSSFEDGITHNSIHLLEEKPDLFSSFTLKERRRIEENPDELYAKLTSDMIISKLSPFLEHHLNHVKK